MAASPCDRISSLPDDVLRLILSFLSLKSAARTSILSHRWKRLWTYVPMYAPVSHPVWSHVLNIGSESDPFINPIIEPCLKFYKSNTLEKIRIHFCPGRKFSSFLDIWIKFAIDLNVKELHLELATAGEEHDDGGGHFGYNLPSFLFRSKSITVLKLHCCVLNPPVSFTGLKHLKTLNLVQVRVRDEILSGLLSECRFLETLCIWACHRLVNPKICGSDLKLRNLLVLGCRGLLSIEIYAPNLVLFEYDANNFPRIVFKNVARLKEVGLFLKEPYNERVLDDWRAFLADISHVEVLNVGSWLLQLVFAEYFVFRSSQMVFENLKEFHFYDSVLTASMVVSLSWVLEGCPRLEKIVINLEYDGGIQPLDYFDEFEDYDWDPDPTDLPFGLEFEVEQERFTGVEYFESVDHLMLSLETIKVSGFSSNGCLLRLLRFILERTRAVETFLLEVNAEEDRQAVEKWRSELPADAFRDRIEILEPSNIDLGVRHLKMLNHVMA